MELVLQSPLLYSSTAHTDKERLIGCFTHTKASGVISVLIKSGIYLKTETNELC